VAAHVQAALAAGAAQARRPDFQVSAPVPSVPAPGHALAKHVQAAVAQARFPAGGSDRPATLHSPGRTLAAHVQAATANRSPETGTLRRSGSAVRTENPRTSRAVQRALQHGGGPPPPPPFNQEKYDEVAKKKDEESESIFKAAIKKGAERFARLIAGPGQKTGGEKEFGKLVTTAPEEGVISSVSGGALFKNRMIAGEIHALENRLGGEAFNNSEVLFQQYKFMFPELPRLRKLVRQNVASAEGAQVFVHVLERGRQQFLPGTEEFNALLGTPNGTAATYLILDHGQELGISTITLAEIEEQDSKIIFHFS
jgi:hypothetical protein